MLRLAGFSSGRGDCARGGWSAGRCGSVAAVCLGSRLTLRFYWNVLPSVHACLFSFVRKKETACGILRSYSVGRDRHSCVLGSAVRLSGFAGSLWNCAFSGGDPDGGRGGRRTESAARCGCVLREPIGFAAFSAGSTLGLRAPDCAKESSTLWTLFTLRRGYVSADSRPYRKRQRPNHRTHACKTQVHGKT